MTKFEDNLSPYLTIVEAAEPAAPSAGQQRLYIDSTTHKLKRTNSSGTDVDIETSGGGTTIYKAHTSRTSGNVVVNGTSWANLDTGLDLSVTAVAGDIIAVSASGIWFSEAVDVYLDAATIVSAAPVNYVGGHAGNNSHLGVAAWTGVTGRVDGFGGTAFYTLVSGDIAAGAVALRLRVRTNTATNKTLLAGTTAPFKWGAINLGQ